MPDTSRDQPDLRILQTQPAPLETDFPLERAMRIRFDRYVDPASVVRQSVLVTPSLIDAETGAPKGPAVFFEPVYDPYERLVVFQLLSGARWIPTTLHRVMLLQPEDLSDGTGFRAFDGTPLDEVMTFTFMTGDSVTNPDEDMDDRQPDVRFCEQDEGPSHLPSARGVLQGCAVGGCHGGAQPVHNLDLSNSHTIRDTAIRVVARQTMTGSSVAKPAVNPARFGDDMPRVDPRSPGNSYLVYKLLVNPDNHPATGETLSEPDPWLGGLPPPGPPSLEELSRLRSWFVRGQPMPPGGQLHPDEMRAIVRWILRGASTPDCIVP